MAVQPITASRVALVRAGLRATVWQVWSLHKDAVRVSLRLFSGFPLLTKLSLLKGVEMV